MPIRFPSLKDARWPLRALLALTVSLSTEVTAEAQTETDLRRALELRMVIARIELPATSDGVDLQLDRDPPIDRGKHEKRLRQRGVAVGIGELALVTCVRVRRNLIELHLDGGGYDYPRPFIGVPGAKELSEIDQEAVRIVEGIWDRIDSHQLSRRGSRINLRFRKAVPPAELRLPAVVQALREVAVLVPDSASPAATTSILPRGSLLEQVRAWLGPPDSSARVAEGSLTLERWYYRVGVGLATCEFVEGLLVSTEGPSGLWGGRDSTSWNPDSLARYFMTGRSVMVRMPLPATSTGFAVHSGTWPPIPWDRDGQLRLDRVAFGRGEIVALSRFRLDRGRIEIGLGWASEFGVADIVGSAIFPGILRKSEREKELDWHLEREWDIATRAKLQAELEGIRSQRNQANEILKKASSHLQHQARAAHERLQEIQIGSRVHLILPEGAPLNPHTIVDALAPLLSFPPREFDPAGRCAPIWQEPLTGAPPGIHGGMLREEVRAVLGAPQRKESIAEGSLQVEAWHFPNLLEGARLDFVAGVLVRSGRAPR